MPRKRRSTKPRLTRVSVRGELRPEPDWDRFAYALLQHVKRTKSTGPRPAGRLP